MAPLGPAPEMVSKLRSRNSGLARRNSSSFSAAPISSSAVQRRRLEPGEETDHGHAVAGVGGAGAGDFALVLARARQQARVVALAKAWRRPPSDAGRTRPASAAGSSRTFLPSMTPKHSSSPCGGSMVTASASAARTSSFTLAGAMKEARAAVGRHHGDGERQRRMGDIAAANVEQPGDGGGRREQNRVVALRRRASSAARRFFRAPACAGDNAGHAEKPARRARRGGRARSCRWGCGRPAPAWRRPSRRLLSCWRAHGVCRRGS